MTTIHMHANTKATPEQFVAGLTNFGPGRAKVFGNSADKDLVVHELSAHHADVTEGSKGVWERLQYDWSNPNHVVATTTDSNAWGGNSSHTYDLAQRPDGTTDIEYTVVRDGKNLRGKFIAGVVGTVGKSVLVKAFNHAVDAIEEQSQAVS